MKVKHTYLFLFSIIFLLLPLFLVSAEEKQEPILRLAQLEEVVGEVYVKRGGGLQDFQAYNGMSLVEGDFIKTYSDSSVTIVFEEDQTILGEHTQVYLARFKHEGNTKKTVLNQMSGQTWNKVKSLLNADDTHDIETATSVMGVRGTLFSVIIDPISSIERLTVLEGLVENKLMRERRANQSGQDVSVSEQVDISSETKERIIDGIDYDDFVQRSDIRIISAIYHDVIERADELFEENEKSTFENTDLEMEHILRTLQSEMMLESLDELTQAIGRIDEEKYQQIEEQLQQRMQKDLAALELEVLEKRLRQIEQYERMREKAILNGLSEDELDIFIGEQGGVRVFERSKEIVDVRNKVEDRLQQIQNKVQEYKSSTINTSNNQDHRNDSLPRNVNNQNLTNNIQIPHDDQRTNELPEEENPVVEDPTPPEEEDPVVEDLTPPEEDPEVEDPTPPEEENPVVEDPIPPEEEDPGAEDPTPPEEEDPGVVIPEINVIQPTYLESSNMVETKSIEEFLVGEMLDNIYQFTGLTEYDPEIVEIIFNQSKTEFIIKGKTEGSTEITVQITDENELIEPVTVTFTVYVENVLPDEIAIPEEFHDLLIVTYEHGLQEEENDRLHISVKDELNGYLNGWLIDGISLWPLSSDQIHDGPPMLIEDPRARLAAMVSCSQDSFMYQIPRGICLDISSIALLEGDVLSIAPIIDPFVMSVETIDGGDGFIVRDFDENGHSTIAVTANGEGHLKTWKVTYEKDGVIRTEDFRDYFISKEMDHQYDSIFSSLLECSNSYHDGGGIAQELCLADVIGITEITAVFGEVSNQDIMIENEKDVPVEIEFLAERNIVKLSIPTELPFFNRLFEINMSSNTQVIEHPEIPTEYYLYSDGEISISIDFVGIPVEIELEGSEQDVENIGSIDQQIEYYEWSGEYFLDFFWLMALPKDGYIFKYWLIIWDNEPMIDDWPEMNISDYMHLDAEVIFKAVFEKAPDGQ